MLEEQGVHEESAQREDQVNGNLGFGGTLKSRGRQTFSTSCLNWLPNLKLGRLEVKTSVSARRRFVGYP
jgi:hypothetical protein